MYDRLSSFAAGPCEARAVARNQTKQCDKEETWAPVTVRIQKSHRQQKEETSMSKNDTSTKLRAQSASPPISTRQPIEFIAIDLAAVREAHPAYAPVIDRMCLGSNPPHIWGVVSTAVLLRRHFVGTTVEQQLKSNVWAFIGETCAQRDQRLIERKRGEMLKRAQSVGGSEELLQILRSLKSSYYLVTYHKNGPATKVLKQ
jgi:hypothetical protein